jgi:hypothetical protein
MQHGEILELQTTGSDGSAPPTARDPRPRRAAASNAVAPTSTSVPLLLWVLVLADMKLQFAHAYTDPRTLRCRPTDRGNVGRT